jgi:hypothetical protein
VNKAIIAYNNDVGLWQWSIGLVGEWGDWIDSFPTKEKAIDFCNEHGYEINHISEWANDHIINSI